MTDAILSWEEAGKTLSARWHSERAASAPKRLIVVDDTLKADAAYHLACEGTAMLWRGDFHNARQLLQAMARRIDRKPAKSSSDPRENFNLHRQAQSQRARILSMLLVRLAPEYHLDLGRAPEVGEACEEAFGASREPLLISLRELLGIIGAHEWRKQGVDIPVLGAKIHPHYGVFSPLRGEYLDLVAQAPLPSRELAFDIGTGTGVIAAILARRGVQRVIATELDSRALACARENIDLLGLSQQVEVIEADLFPQGKAPLIVCNPPWLPARPSSSLEHAIYDADSRMLLGFLNGLAAHLTSGGEGWLILSDLAEHLGLRSRDELLASIEQAGLQVMERIDTRPRHGKAKDPTDPLYAARRLEVTSLWRLAAKRPAD
ncbi:MAG TPA: class I SAM-dependent methyltransferase [Methylophilaceae bacterium]|nr:class I SAM-dependent methyltransferase [Methylophilaceae bacterium]